MGCNASKQQLESVGGRNGRLDDSIHVMILCDLKKQGSNAHYKPRMAHPLLLDGDCDPSGHTAAVGLPEDSFCESSATGGEYSKTETDCLLYHASHHNDTIDPRDIPLAGL
jgi:hypothetical protein